MIQARDDGGLNQVGSTSEKWLDTSYTLNVEIIMFADGLNMRFGKKELMDD